VQILFLVLIPPNEAEDHGK
jgi:hypothetical protein